MSPYWRFFVALSRFNTVEQYKARKEANFKQKQCRFNIMIGRILDVQKFSISLGTLARFWFNGIHSKQVKVNRSNIKLNTFIFFNKYWILKTYILKYMIVCYILVNMNKWCIFKFVSSFKVKDRLAQWDFVTRLWTLIFI